MVDIKSYMGGIAGGATVNIVIKAIDDFSKTFDKAKTSAEKLDKALKYAAVSTAALFAVAIKNGIESEKVDARLIHQLKLRGEATDANFNSLKKLASEMERYTSYADEQVITGQSLLLQFGLTTEQVKKMTPLMLDAGVATAKTTGAQKDLAVVAKMIGDSMNGQSDSLRILGINFSDTEKKIYDISTQTERFDMITKKLKETMGGLALNEGTTLEGKLLQIKNTMGTMLEDLALQGGLIDSLHNVADAFKRIGDAYLDLPDDQKKLLAGGVAAAGATVIGAYGISKGAEMLGNLKGLLPSNPLYVYDVAGGGAAGKVAEGGIIAGIVSKLASVGGTMAATGASSVVAPAALWSMLPDSARLWLEGKEQGPGAMSSQQSYEYLLQQSRQGVNVPDLTQAGIRAGREFLGLDRAVQDVTTTTEEHTDAVSVQDAALKRLIDTEITFNRQMQSLDDQLQKGQITGLEYIMRQSEIQSALTTVRNETMKAVPELDRFTDSIRAVIAASLNQAAPTDSTVTPSRQHLGLQVGASGSNAFGSWSVVSAGWAVGREHQDFISRPGVGVESFSPQDTIIGIKNTSGIGGTSINIKIDNIYGVDADNVAEALGQKLKAMITI